MEPMPLNYLSDISGIQLSGVYRDGLLRRWQVGRQGLEP
jgi:hypothetical protein